MKYRSDDFNFDNIANMVDVVSSFDVQKRIKVVAELYKRFLSGRNGDMTDDFYLFMEENKSELPAVFSLSTMTEDDFIGLFFTDKDLSRVGQQEDPKEEISKINSHGRGKSVDLSKERYVEFKRKLLELLDRAVAKKELLPDGIAWAKGYKKELNEDAFKIVLVGEFQGGKSTTFNMLCDGREISPRGAMIKTSASLITARNLSDLEKAEYAVIHWKSDDEIFDLVSDIIVGRLEKYDKDRFEEIALYPDVLFGRITEYRQYDFKKKPVPLSLEWAKDVELIRRIIDDEWASVERRNDGNGGYGDIVRIAKIIFDNLSNRKLTELRDKKSIQVALREVANYVTFPNNFSTWRNGRCPFAAEELLFAFVSRVDCHLHSSALNQLGCVVIDCPGLFASAWDTMLAKKAMNEANAIVYLFGGEKGLRQEESRALREIGNLKKGKDLFFAFNSKISHKRSIGVIEENIKSALCEIGYKHDVAAYHALLALCSVNWNIVDEMSKKRFIACCRKFYEGEPEFDELEDFESIRQYVIEENVRSFHGKAAEADVRTRFKSDSTIKEKYATASLVSKYAGVDVLLQNVEKHLLSGKGYSMLISNGAVKLLGHIQKSEESVIRQIELDEKGIEEVGREYEAAKQMLNEFLKFAAKITDAELDNFYGGRIEDDFYEYVNKPKELSRMIGNALAKDIASSPGWYLKEALKVTGGKIFGSTGKSQIEINIERIVTNVLRQYIETATKDWMSIIASGRNEIFNDEIERMVKRINNGIENKWRELKNRTMLKLNAGNSISAGGVGVGEVSGLGGLGDRLAVVSVVGLIGSTIGILVAGYVSFQVVATVVGVLLVEFSGGWIVTLIGVILAAIVGCLTGAGLGAGGVWLTQKISEMITTKVSVIVGRKFTEGEVKNKFRKAGGQIVKNFISSIRDFYADARKKVKDEFDEQWNEYLRNANDEKETKQLRVADSKKSLNEIIRPAKKACIAYIQEVENVK